MAGLAISAQLVLPVRELAVSCDWYRSALGMETVYVHSHPTEDPEGNYAILRRDAAEVHLIRDEESDEPGSPHARQHAWTRAGTGYLFLQVQGVEEFLLAATAAGVTPRRGLETEPWGAAAFLLTDPSGNLIRVAERMG